MTTSFLLPCLQLSVIYHVGTMNAQDRYSRHPTSQEGECLSASLCPQSWVEILKLGGLPWWSMTRPQALFVDALALPKGLKKHIESWGIEQGLIDYVEAFEVRRWCEDAEEFYKIICWTRQEAEDEVDEDDDDEHLSSIRCIKDFPVLTMAGAGRAQQKLNGKEMADPFLMQFWVNDVARSHEPDIVGVWYGEELNPYMHSAPRIAVFPDLVTSFDRNVVSADDVDDDEEMLLELPEQQWVSIPVDSNPVLRPRPRG